MAQLALITDRYNTGTPKRNFLGQPMACIAQKAKPYILVCQTMVRHGIFYV